MSDNVNKPSHYNAGSVETIDAIKSALGDAFLDYCRGNVLKYVWRCRHKGKLLEDLRKAAKYLEWAIEEAESEKPSEPQKLAIPAGWRELHNGEALSKADLYDCNGKWNPYTDSNPAGSDFPEYNKAIHYRHIRKIETLEPEPLAIPEGWRELEENEPLSEGDLFDLDGEWVGHECDPSGGVYSSRIHRRHIRKIETLEPEPLAIPEGWRELEFGETRLKTDLYSYGGKWVPYTGFDPAESEFPKYDKRIHQQHIRKIETEKPEHVEGVWVEEADANAKKIEPTEASDASIPDPGPGYRLLSKDPPERVVEGDDFWCDTCWEESDNWRSGGRQCSSYYRRKIESTEWIPKVGDKVRVVRGFANPVGEVGIIKAFCPVLNGEFLVLTSNERCVLGWFKKDDAELVEAAQ